METNTEGREEKIDRIHELGDDHLPDGTFDEECINDDGEFLADVHAILSYEHGGAERVFSSVFHELSDLRHDIRVMANPHARSHPADWLPDCMEFLDTVEMELLGLATELVPGLETDVDDETGDIDPHQALLSNRERKILQSRMDVFRAELTSIRSQVRRRIKSRFMQDIEVLREHEPELFELIEEAVIGELSREWRAEQFAPGMQVRLTDNSVWEVERVIDTGGGVKLELVSSEEGVFRDQPVSGDEVIEIL